MFMIMIMIMKSVLFVVIVLAGCDSLMRGGVCALQQSSIDSQLFIENRDFCLPHLRLTPALGGLRRNIAMTSFGAEKLELCGYPTVKKYMKICLFVSTEYTTRKTDERTDGRTPRDSIRPRLHSIARQKLSAT